MSAPRPAAQQIPAPRATAWMQKPQGGDKFLVHISWGARGDGYGWNWYPHKHNIGIKKQRNYTPFMMRSFFFQAFSKGTKTTKGQKPPPKGQKKPSQKSSDSFGLSL